MQLTIQTRSRRVAKLLAQTPPACTSIQYQHEYYKILGMLRELLDSTPTDALKVWILNLLEDALELLQQLEDPTSTPIDSRRDDNCRWTEISVRRIIAEAMWEEGMSVSFHDCYNTLREGRSRPQQVRLWNQMQKSWSQVTGMDLDSTFTFPSR